MTILLEPQPTAFLDSRTALCLDLVVPVFNEEAQLEASVRRLRHYLDSRFPWAAQVTIADKGSTDATWDIARRLAAELPGVACMRIDGKGRGRALRAAWSASDAAVLMYTDVDLSTDLDALLPLVAPLLSDHSDIAVGSRLLPGSRVGRRPQRELISRAYNGLIRVVLGSGVSDAQCGFKAIRSDVARRLLPLVEDNGWFFDTELLALAERLGLRVHEVAVDWIDDPDSRVDVVATAAADLRGIGRLLRRFACRDVPSAGRARLVTPMAAAGFLGAFLAARPLGAIPAALLALATVAAVRVMTAEGRPTRHGRDVEVLTAAVIFAVLGVAAAGVLGGGLLWQGLALAAAVAATGLTEEVLARSRLAGVLAIVQQRVSTRKQ